MPVHYVNAILHPDHGLLYLQRDEEQNNFPYWVPNLAHAQFLTAPTRKYGAVVIPVTLGKKRLQEVGAPAELNAKQCSPWAWKYPSDDKKTRAAHKQHVEWIKNEAWRRPQQRCDMKLYISIESLTGTLTATTNPLIARQLWGEQIIEGTLIRSLTNSD